MREVSILQLYRTLSSPWIQASSVEIIVLTVSVLLSIILGRSFPIGTEATLRLCCVWSLLWTTLCLVNVQTWLKNAFSRIISIISRGGSLSVATGRWTGTRQRLTQLSLGWPSKTETEMTKLDWSLIDWKWLIFLGPNDPTPRVHLILALVTFIPPDTIYLTRGPLDPNTEVVVAVPQCYQMYARQK